MMTIFCHRLLRRVVEDTTASFILWTITYLVWRVLDFYAQTPPSGF